MKKILRGLALVTALPLGGCYSHGDGRNHYAVAWVPQWIQEYAQRSDTVTLSAGDAQEVNTRVQEIDPWPRHVGNKHIAVSGERMAGAAERYRDVSKIPQSPKPLSVQPTSEISASGGGAGQ